MRFQRSGDGEPTGILRRLLDLINTGDQNTKSPEDEAEKTGRDIFWRERGKGAGCNKRSECRGGDFEAYEKLQKEGELTCRIDIGKPLTGDTDILNKYKELSGKYPDSGDWIRFGYLKAFIDGSMGSGTALMFEPYNDEPSTSGLAMWNYDEFENMVLTADKMGFQIGVHAIGDK